MTLREFIATEEIGETISLYDDYSGTFFDEFVISEDTANDDEYYMDWVVEDFRYCRDCIKVWVR